MILERIHLLNEVVFATPDGEGVLTNIHPESDDCRKFHCAVHNPSDNVMSSFPYNWREDRGIMERICPHGVGHPDLDSAAFLIRTGYAYENVHGCDGCCG